MPMQFLMFSRRKFLLGDQLAIKNVPLLPISKVVSYLAFNIEGTNFIPIRNYSHLVVVIIDILSSAQKFKVSSRVFYA